MKDNAGIVGWLGRPQTIAAAARAAKLLAILMGAAALVTLAALAAGIAMGNEAGIPLFHLLDEMEDGLEMLLFSAVGCAACGCIARALRRRESRSADVQEAICPAKQNLY